MTMIATLKSASPPMILSLVFTAPFPSTSREPRNISGLAYYIAFYAKRHMACSRCQSPGCHKQEAAGNGFDPSSPAIVEFVARADLRDEETEQRINDCAQADEDG